MIIRDARPEDAPQLSVLLDQLGYPSDVAEIPDRLRRMSDHGCAIARVAEDRGQIVGIITSHVLPSLHASEPAAWITALVVSESARSAGLGRQLVAHAEEWARSRGAVKIAVTSALRRTRAHEFYEKNGYAHTGVRLGRAL